MVILQSQRKFKQDGGVRNSRVYSTKEEVLVITSLKLDDKPHLLLPFVTVSVTGLGKRLREGWNKDGGSVREVRDLN